MCTSSPDLGSLNLFSLSNSSFTKMTVSSYRFYTQRSISFALTQRKFTAPSPFSTFSELWSPKMTGWVIWTPPPHSHPHINRLNPSSVCVKAWPQLKWANLQERRRPFPCSDWFESSSSLPTPLIPPAYSLTSGKDMSTKEVRMRAVYIPQRLDADRRWLDRNKACHSLKVSVLRNQYI